MFTLEVKETFVSALNDMDTESIGNLIFSSDPVSRFLHEEVHGVERGSRNDQPVTRLMLAVLKDAIGCIQAGLSKPSYRNKKLFREAEEWISSNDEGILSFNNICEAVGFDPQALRKRLARWKAKQIMARAEERKRLILNKGKCEGKKKMSAQGSSLSPRLNCTEKPPRRETCGIRSIILVDRF